MGNGSHSPSPEFSLNARIPTLPNCVQEGDFNLASTALQNCTTSSSGGVLKTLLAQHLRVARTLCGRASDYSTRPAAQSMPRTKLARNTSSWNVSLE